MLSKKAYWYCGSGGIGLLILLTYLTSWNIGINVGLGLMIGVYPFLSWQLIYRFLPFHTTMTTLKKAVLAVICLLKIVALGLMLWLISQLSIINIVPLLIGITIPIPVILITTLLVYSRVKS